jgi:hypothetical protein
MLVRKSVLHAANAVQQSLHNMADQRSLILQGQAGSHQ